MWRGISVNVWPAIKTFTSKKAVAIIKHLYVVVVLNHSGLEGGERTKNTFFYYSYVICVNVWFWPKLSAVLLFVKL